MIPPKICEGCLSYYIPYEEGSRWYQQFKSCVIPIPKISETLFCPCSKCIIKGVCTEVCDDFLLYKKASGLAYKEREKNANNI